MKKRAFIIVLLAIANSCSNNAQENSRGDITVDKDFTNIFFKEKTIRVGNDGIPIALNAELMEKNRLSYRLDTCEAVLEGDSLRLKFTMIAKPFEFDELVLRINNGTIVGQYLSRDSATIRNRSNAQRK